MPYQPLITYRMFSTATKAKGTNFGYRPSHVLNFKETRKGKFLPVYESFSTFAKVKVAHTFLTIFSVFSLA